jgi:hypothetical protein
MKEVERCQNQRSMVISVSKLVWIFFKISLERCTVDFGRRHWDAYGTSDRPFSMTRVGHVEAYGHELRR